MSELMDQAVIGMPYEMAMEGEVARRQFYSRAQSILAEAQALRDEVARLHSTMIAAAEEIHEHWEAHCDEEGYGPSNLMYRLEKCIDADYPGYTAGAFARMHDELEALRARVVVVPDSPFEPIGEWAERNNGWNYCKDAIARLNGKAVSEGLLRSLLSQDLNEVMAAQSVLSELLGEGKEHDRHA